MATVIIEGYEYVATDEQKAELDSLLNSFWDEMLHVYDDYEPGPGLDGGWAPWMPIKRKYRSLIDPINLEIMSHQPEGWPHPAPGAGAEVAQA